MWVMQPRQTAHISQSSEVRLKALVWPDGPGAQRWELSPGTPSAQQWELSLIPNYVSDEAAQLIHDAVRGA